ncbi:hypothetical protein ABK040_015536 [Willaertia magna]
MPAIETTNNDSNNKTIDSTTPQPPTTQHGTIQFKEPSLDVKNHEEALVKNNHHDDPPSVIEYKNKNQHEICCLGPQHLLFGDTKKDNSFIAYFLWLISTLICCILFPPLTTYLMIYQHPKESVRRNLSEGTVGSNNQHAYTTADSSKMTYLVFSIMLTITCWVPAIIFNFILYFCCVAPSQTDDDEDNNV